MIRRYFWFSAVFVGVFLFPTGCVFSSEPSSNDPSHRRFTEATLDTVREPTGF
jgi:hypothetical protein